MKRVQCTRAAVRPRALVLGIEHPRALAVVRSLGRRGIPVVGVERDPAARGRGSRYLRQIVMVEDGDARTVSALETVAGAPGDLLIPTNDHFLSLVSRHWTRLARRFTLTVPPWDILERLMDKPSCYRLAEGAGLRTPRVVVPGDAAELDVAVSALGLGTQRYILSVRLPGDVPADTATGRMTTVAGEDAEAVRARCLAIAARTGELPMIVEVVPSRSDRCVGVSMVVGRDQVPLVAFCVRRLQLRLYASDSRFVHPYELGANVYCESVHDDEAIEAAARFVRAARFYGAITVEFRRDARDEGLTLIKVDPRVVRATSLSTALGLDVPAALYDVFTGAARPTATAYPERVGWMWPAWYLHTVGQNRGRGPQRAPHRGVRVPERARSASRARGPRGVRRRLAGVAQAVARGHRVVADLRAGHRGPPSSPSPRALTRTKRCVTALAPARRRASSGSPAALSVPPP